MTPVQHDDDDFYINTTLADAQATIAELTKQVEGLEQGCFIHHVDKDQADATIAALQAQLNEQRKNWVPRSFKKWQCWRDPDELVDEYEKWQAAIQEHQSLKDQLTQRTAELEAAMRREVDVWKEKAELRGKEACAQRAELERVSLLSSHNERRFEMLEEKYKELRTLILTLPKVEVVISPYMGDTVENIVHYNFHQWMLRATAPPGDGGVDGSSMTRKHGVGHDQPTYAQLREQNRVLR